VRARWTVPLLVLSAGGALGCLGLHLAWHLRRPSLPLALPVALELGVVLAWLPAVAVFALRAQRRFGSPFSPAFVRAFFPTFFDGTPPWLRRVAILSVAYAWLFLFARWAWQLNDPVSTPPAPADPELTAVAFAFYVLSAAVLAGVGHEQGPGPRRL
jgi:hypothetical protein